MVKYCEGKHERQVVDRAPAPAPNLPRTNDTSEFDITSQPTQQSQAQTGVPRMIPSQLPESDYSEKPHIHIAAIDNSLSFPHQHPKGWRSFVYGWLYLPVSLIGKPFSENTRNHFLPLLSDPAWWTETTYQLRKLHEVDPDFNVRMFQRQMAVMKGQAWNIVQSLKHADEGPLELTRRTKVMVWDEEIEVPVNASPAELLVIVSASQTKPSSVSGDIVASLLNAPSNPQQTASGSLSTPNSPPTSNGALPKSPRDRRSRSISMGLNFPPRSHFRRSSSDLSVRPVPFMSKNREGSILGGATGVSVLEHLERLDEVESGLNRAINRAGAVIEEDEEEDVGSQTEEPGSPKPTAAVLTSWSSLPPLSQSTDPDTSSRRTGHSRWASQSEHDRARRSLDLPRELRRSPTRIVIAERLETVDANPFFSGW
ncbi:phosphatidyl inositol kinase [Tulasnella sp. 418]|nr:phosphatidyl inositol kinase [Tulasnella sp. 418]